MSRQTNINKNSQTSTSKTAWHALGIIPNLRLPFLYNTIVYQVSVFYNQEIDVFIITLDLTSAPRFDRACIVSKFVDEEFNYLLCRLDDYTTKLKYLALKQYKIPEIENLLYYTKVFDVIWQRKYFAG